MFTLEADKVGGRVGIRMDRWVDAVPVSSARIATRAKKKMEIRTGKKIKFDIPAAKLGEKSVVLASSRSRNRSNSSSNGPAPVVESGGGTSRGNGGIRDSAPAARPETSGRARMVLLVVQGMAERELGSGRSTDSGTGPLAQANDAIPGRYRLTIQGLGTSLVIGYATRGHAPRSRRARGVGRIVYLRS